MPSFGSMNKNELLDEADARNITVPDGSTNDEIIALLEANDGKSQDTYWQTRRATGGMSGGSFAKDFSGGDGGASQVQEHFDKAQAKGYFGTTTDPTPRENYGALYNDAPTPETDEELNLAARKAAGIR